MAYDQQKFSKKLLSSCYQNELGNTTIKYACLEQDIQQVRACLKMGYPFTVQLGLKFAAHFGNWEIL